MAISGPKPLVSQFQDNLSFSTCGSFYLIGQKVVFFVLEYRKTHFSSPYCLKKKSWKNVNFSPLRTSCFYSLERGFFVLEYHKRHFPDLYCLTKKAGKMAIFGAKPWVNHFGKMSIFRLFELLVFIAQKGVFSFQNIAKHIFLAHIALKKS